MKEMAMERLNWFNLGAPIIKVRGRYVRFWNLFNRVTNGGDHWWGVGVLQIGNRHLFCASHGGWSVLFVGKTA